MTIPRGCTAHSSTEATATTTASLETEVAKRSGPRLRRKATKTIAKFNSSEATVNAADAMYE